MNSNLSEKLWPRQNEEKSGDKLAGIAAETAEERVAAKVVLSNLTLENLRENPAVPYEEDEVTELSRMESTNLFTTASRAGPFHSSASGSSIQRPPET